MAPIDTSPRSPGTLGSTLPDARAQPATCQRTSADEATDRFSTPAAAAKYNGALDGTPTHRREMRCVLRALQGLPNGSRVLDIPCGTGRLLPELTERGLVVTEADVSPHMVERARALAESRGVFLADDRLVVTSVFQTPFADDAFDATVCNRLLHHFYEPQTRRQALAELRRITRGLIVASFFNSASWDGLVFHARDWMRSKRAADRVPITSAAIRADAAAVGLKVLQRFSARPVISKQCYVVLARAE